MIDFKTPYARQNALSFLSQFLPDDFQESIEEDIRLNYKPQFIGSVTKLGEVASLQSLHVFEALHDSENDPRVGLSRDVFRLLANFGVRKALVFFISKKSPNYRLSLVTLDLKWEEGKRIEKEYSNPRRYSFFLGQEAKVHTPTSFLIKSGRVKSLTDLISRFDVEIVTKEFFQKYKELFEGLCESLKKDHVFSKVTARGEISVETFAKKLLGQIVFCYFLQKKGWLGAAKGRRVVEGDKDFMRSMFERYKKEGKDYFNEGLEYLFYDALNRTPEGDDYYRSHFYCQIPFLNGGLFEPLQDYDWKGEFLYLSDDLFSNKKGTGILDVFDLYNFTVYEDDPIDREVSVDPEMLGKVFENLLPENIRKGQGAYYTPREIVHYMCQESLVNSLIANTKVGEVRVRELVHDKELSLDQRKGRAAAWRKEKDELIAALKGIRVCDPACGSGAFLVGMLHEIVEIRRFLQEEENTYQIRKETIQNCIYGVDIDPGAVEIAKLRLWLSLVVDYELDEIEPLPNLDYKIMCGNSLLEELIVGDEAIKLVDEKMLASYRRKSKSDVLFSTDGLEISGSTERRDYLLKVRAEKQQHLLDLNETNKLTREKRVKIEDELAVINKELDPKKSKVKSADQHPSLFSEKADKYFETLKKLHKDYFNESDPVRKKNKRDQIESIEMEFIKASVQERVEEADTLIRNLNMQNPDDRRKQVGLLQKKLDCMGIPERIRRSRVRPYFLWKLNFCDVFEEKDGFDIVIANPPYIKEDVNRFAFDGLRGADCYQGKMDIWYLFGSKGLDILRNCGVMTFIATNNWVTNDGASKFRNKIIKHGRIIDFIDFADYKVFSAGIQTMVFVVLKDQELQEYNLKYAKLLDNKADELLLTSFLHEANELSNDQFEKFKVSIRRDLYLEGYIKFVRPNIGLVLDKINRASSLNLLDHEIFSGIDVMQDFVAKSHLERLGGDSNVGDGVFVLTDEEKIKINWNDEELKLIKPYYTTREISQYCANKANRYWIIYTGASVNSKINIYPNIKKHLDRFSQIITSVNKPYGLHRTRNEEIFLDQKILSIRKCAAPSFSLVDFPCYVSRAFLIIKTNRVSLKYLLAILNSKVIAFWLRHKGKLQGSQFQVDKVPLMSIPIALGQRSMQEAVIDLADKILLLTSNGNHSQNEIQKYERQIDLILYDAYGLTKGEIALVESVK